MKRKKNVFSVEEAPSTLQVVRFLSGVKVALFILE
jgi:hypothetical protein